MRKGIKLRREQKIIRNKNLLANSKTGKAVRIILTIECSAQHPFACQNAQQILRSTS